MPSPPPRHRLELRAIHAVRIVLVGFSVVLLYTQYSEWAAGRWDLALAMQLVVYVAATAVLWMARRVHVQADALLFFLLMNNLLALLHYGPGMSVGVIYVAVPVAAYLFFGPRGLVSVSLAVVASVFIAAVVHGQGLAFLHPPPAFDLADPSVWARQSVNTLPAIAAVVGVIVYLLGGLRQSSEEAQKLLERERVGHREHEAEAQARHIAALTRACAQHQEAVGRIAGSAAHELNNVLTTVIGSAELARLKIADSRVVLAELERIVGNAQRAAVLARQLMAFSRKAASRPTVLDAAQVIRDMGRMVERLLPENIQWRMSLPAHEVWVHLDPVHLEQVVLNLVVNARDAMPEGGHLRIEVSTSPGPPEEVRIEVTDDGSGIAPELQDRIFEPDFTTKVEGLGTGLGLATVRSIVGEARGGIELRSTPGVGTTFEVRLPTAVVEDPDQAASSEEFPLPECTGTETILVADDDPQVRRTISHMLEDAGYEVHQAASGTETLARLGEGDHLDLVLLDVVMPGPSGIRLFNALRELRPDLCVVFCTGFDTSVFGKSFFDSPDRALVRKPFSRLELLRTVRHTLDARQE